MDGNRLSETDNIVGVSATGQKNKRNQLRIKERNDRLLHLGSGANDR